MTKWKLEQAKVLLFPCSSSSSSSSSDNSGISKN